MSYADNTAGPAQTQSGISFPPSLMGRIARFIYAQAPVPNGEVAIAGAVAFMAGIAGRAYKVDDLGLNQYIVVLGISGIGKDAALKGIRKLNAELFAYLTSNAGEFGQGHFALALSGEFASSMGLHNFIAGDGNNAKYRALAKDHSEFTGNFASLALWDEITTRLSEWINNGDTGPHSETRALLLELFTSSGAGGYLAEKHYADTKK